METPGDNPVPDNDAPVGEDSFFDATFDDASRARRARLVPPWLIWTVAGIVAVSVLLVGFLIWRDQAIQRKVPQLVGLKLDEARIEARKAGLELREGDRRFSTDAPKDYVLQQDPAPGTVLDAGQAIVVDVSAGSETFEMPQVVGAEVNAAMRLLRGRGLSVEIDSVSSEQPTGTVLSSFPEAGTTITTSDVVRITVSSGKATSDLLLPVDLTGRRIAIDPAPVPDLPVDTTLEVARRLRALLQASGAEVSVTRTASNRSSPDSARAARAKKARPDALVVVSVAETGGKGVSVTYSQATGGESSKSKQLAGKILARLQEDKLASGETSPGVDIVLSAVPAAGAEVGLGSLADASDTQRLKDPAFAEKIARAIYRGVADTFAPSD